jgi:N-acetylneuraminic acid mutarotase
MTSRKSSVIQFLTLTTLLLSLTFGTSIFSLAAASGTWTAIANMHNARESHTATLLSNGNVVVAGGQNNGNVIANTEVYSPTTGGWTASGNLNTARASANAVLLASGSVLVAGGCVSACLSGNTTTAELYHSVSGTWSYTGSMAAGRVYFGMVLLSSGKVLAMGGCTGQNSNGCTGVTASAEIYDPSAGTWSATGSMKAARGAFTATLLQSGKVLVAGGINGAGNPIKSAELYDPSTGKFSYTGSLGTARDEHTATLLANGYVMVTGGENTSSVSTTKCETYNPSTKVWSSAGNLATARQEHDAVMLANGNILVSGGNKVTASTTTVLSSAEIYNSTTGAWSKTGSMKAARVGHSSTLLQSGQVLNAGGSGANNELSSAETYQP